MSPGSCWLARPLTPPRAQPRTPAPWVARHFVEHREGVPAPAAQTHKTWSQQAHRAIPPEPRVTLAVKFPLHYS